MIKKRLKLSNDDFYRVHLQIVNSVLPVKMSGRELSVLAKFMSLNGKYDYRFSTDARNEVMEALSISPSNLSNNLSSLVKKKFLIAFIDSDGKKRYKVNPIVGTDHKRCEYNFLLENAQTH